MDSFLKKKKIFSRAKYIQIQLPENKLKKYLFITNYFLRGPNPSRLLRNPPKTRLVNHTSSTLPTVHLLESPAVGHSGTPTAFLLPDQAEDQLEIYIVDLRFHWMIDDLPSRNKRKRQWKTQYSSEHWNHSTSLCVWLSDISPEFRIARAEVVLVVTQLGRVDLYWPHNAKLRIPTFDLRCEEGEVPPRSHHVIAAQTVDAE